MTQDNQNIYGAMTDEEIADEITAQEDEDAAVQRHEVAEEQLQTLLTAHNVDAIVTILINGDADSPDAELAPFVGQDVRDAYEAAARWLDVDYDAMVDDRAAVNDALAGRYLTIWESLDEDTNA